MTRNNQGVFQGGNQTQVTSQNKLKNSKNHQQIGGKFNAYSTVNGQGSKRYERARASS